MYMRVGKQAAPRSRPKSHLVMSPEEEMCYFGRGQRSASPPSGDRGRPPPPTTKPPPSTTRSPPVGSGSPRRLLIASKALPHHSGPAAAAFDKEPLVAVVQKPAVDGEVNQSSRDRPRPPNRSKATGQYSPARTHERPAEDQTSSADGSSFDGSRFLLKYRDAANGGVNQYPPASAAAARDDDDEDRNLLFDESRYTKDWSPSPRREHARGSHHQHHSPDDNKADSPHSKYDWLTNTKPELRTRLLELDNLQLRLAAVSKGIESQLLRTKSPSPIPRDGSHGLYSAGRVQSQSASPPQPGTEHEGNHHAVWERSNVVSRLAVPLTIASGRGPSRIISPSPDVEHGATSVSPPPAHPQPAAVGTAGLNHTVLERPSYDRVPAPGTSQKDQEIESLRSTCELLRMQQMQLVAEIHELKQSSKQKSDGRRQDVIEEYLVRRAGSEGMPSLRQSPQMMGASRAPSLSPRSGTTFGHESPTDGEVRVLVDGKKGSHGSTKEAGSRADALQKANTWGEWEGQEEGLEEGLGGDGGVFDVVSPATRRDEASAAQRSASMDPADAQYLASLGNNADAFAEQMEAQLTKGWPQTGPESTENDRRGMNTQRQQQVNQRPGFSAQYTGQRPPTVVPYEERLCPQGANRQHVEVEMQRRRQVAQSQQQVRPGAPQQRPPIPLRNNVAGKRPPPPRPLTAPGFGVGGGPMHSQQRQLQRPVSASVPVHVPSQSINPRMQQGPKVQPKPQQRGNTPPATVQRVPQQQTGSVRIQPQPASNSARGTRNDLPAKVVPAVPATPDGRTNLPVRLQPATTVPSSHASIPELHQRRGIRGPPQLVGVQSGVPSTAASTTTGSSRTTPTPRMSAPVMLPRPVSSHLLPQDARRRFVERLQQSGAYKVIYSLHLKNMLDIGDETSVSAVRSRCNLSGDGTRLVFTILPPGGNRAAGLTPAGNGGATVQAAHVSDMRVVAFDITVVRCVIYPFGGLRFTAPSIRGIHCGFVGRTRIKKIYRTKLAPSNDTCYTLYIATTPRRGRHGNDRKPPPPAIHEVRFRNREDFVAFTLGLHGVLWSGKRPITRGRILWLLAIHRFLRAKMSWLIG